MLMTEKTLLMKPFILALQKKKIDFLHIRNSGFGGKSQSFFSHAFDEKLPCDKYFADIIFAYGGDIHMAEFGLPGKHIERKKKQADRMKLWKEQGGVIPHMVYTVDELTDLMEELCLL